MSTPTPAPISPAPAARSGYTEIKIVSHSNLFYWWPVWAMGFIITLLTYFDSHHMAIVPKSAVAEHARVVVDLEGEGKLDMLRWKSDPKADQPENPYLHVSKHKSYGVLYCFVLLLVIVITNVPLRGLWSFMVIITLVMLSVILHLWGKWEPILDALGKLHIYINAAGYFLISLVLFVAWIITFFLFDSQIYMVFTPGQLRVRQEIGGGEVAYDTAGMMIQKQRNDLFRHWVLGLGSGDLIVTTSGASSHHFDLPNVLFVGQKVRQIEDMLREKAVV
jgi:hypothetical protein